MIHGDTHAGVKYKPRKGLESKFFQHANQVIFRSPQDDVWAHLLCGYKTHIHKHSDNGAFILYYQGKDLLVDPGFLNYESSEESLLLKSSSFHNTACPKDEDQEIKKIEITGEEQSYAENISSSRICSFIQLPNIESAFSVISDYRESSIDRLVIWLKPKSFVVFDTLRGSNEILEQFYHIAPGLQVDTIDEKEVRVFLGDVLQCTISPVDVEGLPSGSYEIETLPGYVASSFNERKESVRIKITSKQGYACTVISLGGAVDKSALGLLTKEKLSGLMLDA